MKQYIRNTFICVLTATALSGCDDFLDTMPDNRTTLDTEDKIEKMITSAYLDHEYCTALELMSDNTDDCGEKLISPGRWYDDTFNWRDESENDNACLKTFWETAYSCIAAANEALDALGPKPETEKGRQLRAEALLCRAYNHFMLGCIFCQPWTDKAEQHLGLPYMKAPEKDLNPKYDRGNLADFYKNIQADIEEALPYVSDSYYSVPKYHFNIKAAYAFATRFYLYSQQWENAISAATRCLGSDPSSMLRNWAAMEDMTTNYQAFSDAYINASENANLLLITGHSSLGVIFGPFEFCGRYNHSLSLAASEDLHADNIFGDYTNLRMGTHYYESSECNKLILWKAAFKFEYTDLVAGVGIRHTVVPVLTTDETLLNRAEAYIMTGQYNEAAADLTMWMKNTARTNNNLTPQTIVNFYKRKNYSYYDDNGLLGTLKKHLNPAFEIDVEGSVQESMLQCLLSFRRIETIHQGLRWFDINRYGIEIPRRVMNERNQPFKKTDFLSKDDLRRVVQLPQDVIVAGLEANPR